MWLLLAFEGIGNESNTLLYRKIMKEENQQKDRNGSSSKAEVPPTSLCVWASALGAGDEERGGLPWRRRERGLGVVMKLPAAVRWYFSFFTRLSSVAACSAQEQWYGAAWAGRPAKGPRAIAHSIFMLMARCDWERMFGPRVLLHLF